MCSCQFIFTPLNSALSKHILGTAVTLTSYSQSNPYECPSDGYVICTSGTATSSVGGLFIGNQLAIAAVGNGTQGSAASMFIRAGMKVYGSAASGGSAKFYPLS